MRTLSPLSKPKNKKAISNMVSYVLLISITIALSALVYNWLKFYVDESDIPECSDDVNIIIENYTCISGLKGSLNITIRNKGLFDIDGYILKVHDRPDAKFGFYTLEDNGGNISVTKFNTTPYFFSEYPEFNLKEVTLIEVQPYMGGGKNTMSCRSFTTQKITCKHQAFQN